ncbi:orotidine-5'-phosphate decarboxylase [Limosilactobacillus gastricus]|uniref:orotidine-5'-phosphate decarboxylase n=1 Tax=Limosilactobacillus gastricus TaxID=227942 RepID=UPI0026E95142|nr:orotidine-5'-phosphate decarboxylase [Limosilactobacillus gastricus]
MEHFVPMVAIDVDTKEAAEQLFDQLSALADKPIVKIGMELYYANGPAIIKAAQAKGLKIFLDLKGYDIPNTIRRSMEILGQLGVDFTTVHAAGGSKMIQAAKEGLTVGAKTVNLPTPKLLAVTQLTSMDEDTMHREQGIPGALVDSVKRYAQLAEKAGADGVICSALEVKAIREVTQDDFLCVTPGIRSNLNQTDDQSRVVTPAQARQIGSNGIVVGRPITQSDDPVASYQTIYQAFMGETK